MGSKFLYQTQTLQLNAGDCAIGRGIKMGLVLGNGGERTLKWLGGPDLKAGKRRGTVCANLHCA